MKTPLTLFSTELDSIPSRVFTPLREKSTFALKNLELLSLILIVDLYERMLWKF